MNLVIRGGYGIFYQAYSHGVQGFFDFVQPPFWRLFVGIGPANASASLQNPFPDLPLPTDFPITPRIFSPPFSAARPAISTRGISDEFRSPYIQHYSLNIQYEFAKDFLLEIGYVGSVARKLNRFRNLNQALLASPERPVNGITENAPENAVLRVPFLGFTPLGVQIVESSANSSYNSFQLSVTKRLSKGLQFLASYTLAKSIDDAITVGPDGRVGIQTPPVAGDNRTLEHARGLSDFDRRHRFVYSFVYDLPAFGGSLNNSPIGSKLFRGWQIAGIITLQSGIPFNIVDPAGATLFGVNTSQAQFAPGATRETAKLKGSVNERLSRFFKTSAFTRAGAVFGNVGRNILCGPDQRNVDFSLIKRTFTNETHNIEFRAEFFNIFNTVNFANPGSNIASPASFGVISGSSAAPRVIQFALKYNF